jgi:hypothetical protein
MTPSDFLDLVRRYSPAGTQKQGDRVSRRELDVQAWDAQGQVHAMVIFTGNTTCGPMRKEIGRMDQNPEYFAKLLGEAFGAHDALAGFNSPPDHWLSRSNKAIAWKPATPSPGELNASP